MHADKRATNIQNEDAVQYIRWTISNQKVIKGIRKLDIKRLTFEETKTPFIHLEMLMSEQWVKRMINGVDYRKMI